MRASGRDIVELFGYRPDDVSGESKSASHFGICPFISGQCTKTNHDKSVVYGVCSVSHGISKQAGTEVIVCPKRLYSENYKILQDVISLAWPNEDYRLVAGGRIDQLAQKANDVERPAIAFGQNSGNEIQVQSNGTLSMDWIIQSYDKDQSLKARNFVGVEVQSIDITGNYRNNREAYRALRSGAEVSEIPDSGHGLNWANVHKRLIPQLIRKGNIYRHCERCVGFFFLVPEIVFQRFEEVLGGVEQAEGMGREVLSVITYGLGNSVDDGKIRSVERKRILHYFLEDVASSFMTNFNPEAPEQLDKLLAVILDT